jgi:transposase
MREVIAAFRLPYDHGRSQREIARALGLSQSTVNDYLRRFRGAGLPWPLPPDVDEAAVETQLFATTDAAPARGRTQPDWPTLHAELKRKGVTLQLLWIEYKRATPDGYQYTQFCQHYRTWADTVEPALRQVHIAGEKTFVDYAGLTMPVHDLASDTVREAQIFVAALGASHLLFAEPTWTQALPDWIGSHVRMLDYFGGVTALIVPDNLKAGVTSPCSYEPIVHATYQDFATHYGTAILPARVRHPRDKAKVETAVQIVARDPGPAAARRLSLARRTGARHCLGAGAREHAAVSETRGQSPQRVRRDRARDPAPAARQALRTVRMAHGQGEHRQSHLGRRASVQRPVSPHRRHRHRATDRRDGGDSAPRHSRRLSRAQRAEGAIHHRAQSPLEGA